MGCNKKSTVLKYFIRDKNASRKNAVFIAGGRGLYLLFIFIFPQVSALIFLYRNAKSSALIGSLGGVFVGNIILYVSEHGS